MISVFVPDDDMDLIEVLWKQDVDLGFTLADVEGVKSDTSTSKDRKKESADELEKLKALEAVNATKNEDKAKDSEEKEDDPWAGLSYTVDLETGEYILTSGSPSVSGPESLSESPDQLSCAQLTLNDPPIGLVEDSLGLNENFGLEDDFPSELLNDSLLGSTGVEGLLSNDSLGLPDGFNLEEALQLVGLNEVAPNEIKSEGRKKRSDCSDKLSDTATGAASTAKNCDKESTDDFEKDMIHTPQLHPHHPHHRPLQGRVPFVRSMSSEQRWPGDFASILSLPDHFGHSTHSGYSGHTLNHPHYEAQRNVLLHNATLAPPVGDLNSTGPYHNVGGPSNFGSAVATSMNLTNSSEPLGHDNSNVYKAEPNDMMYYHTPSETINQTTDGFISSLLSDEDLHLMDMAMNDGMYSMRLLDNSSNNATGPTGGGGGGAVGLPGVTASSTTTTGPSVTNLGVTDERLDASSDSAVSSMGSERVPSLSDGEWMETGSNSSHTQADSHYSMDYASKYRMPYECNYSLSGRNSGSPRCQGDRIPPVAQKKHQMFAKRYFQEQGTGSPIGPSTHPSTPIKYEYDHQAIGSGAPGNAYAGPIEGAAGPHPELKYSCSVDFSRHQSVSNLPGRTALEHLHHNHTYHLPPDSIGAMQRPIIRDKKGRKNESDENLTRDEKRARAHNVPIPVKDIINLPMDEFNERLSKYDLNENQLSLIRDIRRRGKNKVAAQNCRKRKLDQITSLEVQVKEMKDRKTRLIREREYMMLERQRVKDKFTQLYHHVFQSLRDSDGNQYHINDYCLQQSADGNVLLVPRNQTNPNHSRQCSSSMDQKGKPNSEHKE
ncbi:segmentation protein cap'n'collar isoform X3 [Chelonus insularis]|uniref:segmentation protein cap'n'collar isoform X3 n=1 Tax=Chelonus insularis TaxID=460826 RepID=UPI00158B4D43|nr:segmentation protein cap'n'collar isoform X3 [Chelonus insularis]